MGNLMNIDFDNLSEASQNVILMFYLQQETLEGYKSYFHEIIG